MKNFFKNTLIGAFIFSVLASIVAAVIYNRISTENVTSAVRSVESPKAESKAAETTSPPSQPQPNTSTPPARIFKQPQIQDVRRRDEQTRRDSDMEEARRRDEQARRDADQSAWSDAGRETTRTNNIEPIKRYLGRFPDGAHAKEARQFIAKVEEAFAKRDELAREMARLTSQFSIRKNTEITSNFPQYQPYNSVYTFPNSEGGAIVECMALCLRTSTCLAFTATQPYQLSGSCRIFDSVRLETTVNPEWITGVRR